MVRKCPQIFIGLPLFLLNDDQPNDGQDNQMQRIEQIKYYFHIPALFSLVQVDGNQSQNSKHLTSSHKQYIDSRHRQIPLQILIIKQ